jgi:DNA-binding protein H-NS
MVDLSQHSLAQLRDLQSQVAVQIKEREKTEIMEVQQRILALANSVGMTVEQIMKGTKTKKVAPVRFRHPEQSELQWSGRGRQPGWVKEYLESGKSLDSIKVA